MNQQPAWALAARPESSCDYPLGDLFAYGNKRSPDRIAVEDGKSSFTFEQLEAMAIRLAAWLFAHGVRSGTRVPVLADKRALMPALAVAIWKLGAVYVPLDGQLPEARVRKLVARLQGPVALAISRAPLADCGTWLAGAQLLEVCLEGSLPSDLPSWPSASGDTAYIIFTSGSTGEPKGVEISIASLKDYFAAHNEVLRFDEASRVFSLSPFHFDVSIEDTLLPLSLGAYVYQFGNVHVGSVMRSILMRQRITHLIAVSTLLSLITEDGRHINAEQFPALDMVMTGAEVCDPKLINLWRNRFPNLRLFNAYGPTETTIVCLCHAIETADEQRMQAYPIGKPLQGVHCLIVDTEGGVLDDGSAGELCIGGSLVMKGYLDQSEETEKVIFEHQGLRFYRTGDICQMQADGDILYIGRKDDEVKLAGRRIHLGEVRQKCLACPGVERAAIRVLEQGGRKHIAVVLTGTRTGILTRVEQALRAELPGYMVPSLWGWAEDVDLSSNGKTDERTLLDQLSRAVSQHPGRYYVRPEGHPFIPWNGIDHEHTLPL